MNRLAELAVTLAEVAGVLRSLPRVEAGRCSVGPRPLVESLRRCARRMRHRGPVARRCLRRAIFWVDACLGRRANCYRRALLEVALDRGAAREPLALGLNAQGGQIGGHAWLASDADVQSAYDVVIEV
ncbi:MAG: hypothetical protein K2R98_18150 [Gemmataceae bacterium]|nr:hypothetical protein [Gemmataceae bacterium]